MNWSHRHGVAWVAWLLCANGLQAGQLFWHDVRLDGQGSFSVGWIRMVENITGGGFAVRIRHNRSGDVAIRFAP